jgi:alpha-glucosidase (family GH31 glycosyl hydrolase)
MYTCLFKVHMGGGSCVNPTFFKYPDEEELYKDTEATFLVGGSVLVAPVLSTLTDVSGPYDVYFPKGKWVNLANVAEIIDTTTAGATKSIKAGGKVNAYLKAGSIIPI